MRIPRTLRLATGVTAVAAIAAVAMWPDTLTVETATAARAPMRVTIDEDGETRVRDRFVVSAPVAGHLQRIELEPGDRVTRGETLIRLAPAESPLLDPRSRVELEAAATAAQEAYEQARAESDRAAAWLERATAAARRLAGLVDVGAVSREDFETAQTARQSAAMAKDAAQHAASRAESEWRLAQARLRRPSVRGGLIDVVAPVSGVVLKRLRESECIVTAGEPLIEIGDPTRIEVVADLLSTDAVRIPLQAPVAIERWGGAQALTGRVRRVEPSGFLKISALGVEEQRVNVIIDFDDPAAASRLLGDGYRVEIRATAWQSGDALTVPIGALFRSGRDWAVFVADGDRARLQSVQIGERNNEVAQVTGGLREGQRVVMHPSDALTDGTRIRARP